MIGTGSLVIGIVMVLVVGAWIVRRVRGGGQRRNDEWTDEEAESWERHEEATERTPPVKIGEDHEAGVIDFSQHHSGEEHAVCKVQGFVVFVQNSPDDLEVGDVVQFTIASFNRGHTSATGAYRGRA